MQILTYLLTVRETGGNGRTCKLQTGLPENLVFHPGGCGFLQNIAVQDPASSRACSVTISAHQIHNKKLERVAEYSLILFLKLGKFGKLDSIIHTYSMR